MGRHLRGQTGLHDAGGQRRELFQGHAGRAEPSHRQLFRGGRRGQPVDRYGGRRSELLGPEERPLRLLYAGEPQRHYVEHDQAAALRRGRKAADFGFQRRHQVVRRAAGAFFRPAHVLSGLAAAAERLRFFAGGRFGNLADESRCCVDVRRCRERHRRGRAPDGRPRKRGPAARRNALPRRTGPSVAGDAQRSVCRGWESTC